jgi:hypothetical protein
MVPIRCNEGDIAMAQAIFPCYLSSFLLSYLGLLLSVSTLPCEAFQPLIDRMANRLSTWKGKLLRRSGWLTLIKTTLSAGPVYTMINIKVPT